MTDSILRDLVLAMNKEEVRNFKLYINRLNSGLDDNKRASLFDLLRDPKKGLSELEIQEIIYPGNRNAFYKLKNKLRNDIEESLLILHRQRDQRFPVYKRIQLAHIFRYKSKYERAFEYLKKAESLARKQDNFELLHSVYNEILALASDYYKIDPEIYVQKRQENIDKNKHIQQANFLIATVNHRLWNSNFSGKERELTEQLEKIQEDLMIDPEIADTPYVQLALNRCVRTILLQNKDFKALESYLKSTIERFDAVDWFGGQHWKEIFVHLNWLINVSVVNMKFEQALVFTDRLKDSLELQKGKYKAKFQWIYHQSLVMNHSFLGNNDKVIELLEQIIADPHLKGSTFYDVFAYLNLAVSYFNAGNVELGLRKLKPILDVETFKALPRGLRLGISLVELILHYENGDEDYVEHLVTDIRRKFRKELKEEGYHREKELLGIIRILAAKLNPLKNKKIVERMEAFQKASPPFQPGSNEAINYQVWLKSLQVTSTYYEIILLEIERLSSPAVG